LQGILKFFADGGPIMYLILLMMIFGTAVILERFIFIRFKTRIDTETFVNKVLELVKSGNIARAIEYCSMSNAALPKIAKAGLLELSNSPAEVQNAMELAAMAEVPKIEKRTGYLSMIANVATLLGLLGTISGLINAFAAVAHADAADKASLLTAGISVAMNATAFGLGVAISCLIAYTFLVESTNELVDEINENSARLYIHMTSKRL
jgi:biopolymer transport protein ExbB